MPSGRVSGNGSGLINLVPVSRMTSSQRAATTPTSGSLIADTTTGFLYTGDGSTSGGVVPMLPSSSVSAAASTTFSGGTVIETYDGGQVVTTTFGGNTVIETYGAPVNKTRTTTFASDGTITVTFA